MFPILHTYTIHLLINTWFAKTRKCVINLMIRCKKIYMYMYIGILIWQYTLTLIMICIHVHTIKTCLRNTHTFYNYRYIIMCHMISIILTNNFRDSSFIKRTCAHHSLGSNFKPISEIVNHFLILFTPHCAQMPLEMKEIQFSVK